MKSTLLTLILILFFTQIVNACPVWRVGKVIVVDEFNQPIKDAKIIRYYNNGLDSSIIEVDSQGYNVYNGGRRGISNINTKTDFFRYRVIADGYADWKIRDFSFNGARENIPILKIVMSHHKYMFLGNVYTKVKAFSSDKIEHIDKDTFTLSIDQSIEKTKKFDNTTSAQLRSALKVNSYPNPVKDQLNIEVKDSIVLPYKAVICELNGRVILEQELTQNLTGLNLQFESAGFYLVSVYKHDGELLYSTKFIKQ
ncbi:MAG TPA: T9SS type A sorting domain-containing protein [Bacteroidia bacterium]